MLYFDHAATTPIYPEVISLLNLSFSEDFANPASQHRLGKEMAKKIELARSSILEALDAHTQKYQVVFTSSATESNNQVIKSFNKDRILHYLSDHPSVTNCFKEQGLHLNDSESLIERVSDETELVILSHVNSQSGQIRDVNRIAKHLKEINPKVRILVDSAQGIGKIPLSLKDESIDYLVMAAHKIGGPRGIAALITRIDAPLKPLLNGGGHELNVRASTPSTPLSLGLEKAIHISLENLSEKLEKMTVKSQRLKEELRSIHPNIDFPFGSEDVSPYINTMTFKGLPSDVLLRTLERKKVYVSSSTACSSKVKVKNKMLLGLGLKEDIQKNVLRISMCQKTTDDELNEFLSLFKEAVEELSFLIK